jgi:hypothetical protein
MMNKVLIVSPIGLKTKKIYAIGIEVATKIPIILPLSSGDVCSAKKAPQATGITPATIPSTNETGTKTLISFTHRKAYDKTEATSVKTKIKITFFNALSIRNPQIKLEAKREGKKIWRKLHFSIDTPLNPPKKTVIIDPNKGNADSHARTPTLKGNSHTSQKVPLISSAE